MLRYCEHWKLTTWDLNHFDLFPTKFNRGNPDRWSSTDLSRKQDHLQPCYDNEHESNDYDDIPTLDIYMEIQLIQLDNGLLELSGFL